MSYNNNKSAPNMNINNQDNWYPIPKAPDGLLHQSLTSPPRIHSPPAPPVDSNAKSHEILGGIILGSGHHTIAQNLDGNPLPTSYVCDVAPTRTKQDLCTSLFNNPNNANRPSTPKSSKYVGVTFRPTRVKYQARIYKDNKEYNLGLFDVSADAALAYDITHRLMIEMTRIGEKELSKDMNANGLPFLDRDGGATEESTKAILEKKASSAIAARVRIELSNLTDLERDPELSSAALNWLDEAETDASAEATAECERMNFHHPSEYHASRQKEIDERNLKIGYDNCTLTNCQGTCPRLDDLKKFIRQESVKVAKAIIAHTAGIPVPGDESGKKKRKKDSDNDSPEAGENRRKRQDTANTPNPPAVISSSNHMGVDIAGLNTGSMDMGMGVIDAYSVGTMSRSGISAGAVGAGVNGMYGLSSLGIHNMNEANALHMQNMNRMGLSGLGHPYVNGAAGVGISDPSALHMQGTDAHPMNAMGMPVAHMCANHMNPQMMVSANGFGMHGGVHFLQQNNPFMTSNAAMMGCGQLAHGSLHGMPAMRMHSGNVMPNPYGHLPGNTMMMSPSAMGGYLGSNMMMTGGAGNLLMLQRRQHAQAGQYGMNPQMMGPQDANQAVPNTFGARHYP